MIVGSIPSQPQSFCIECAEFKVQIEEIFKTIMSFKTTKQISSQSDAPAALKALGVDPSVRYSTSSNVSTITTQRRISDSESIYFIYSSSTITETISLKGEGFPLMLNFWTGEVTPIAAFETAGGYTKVKLTLGESAAQAIYLGKRNPYGISNLSKHVTATDAEVFAESGNLFLRSNRSGIHTARLSNGKTVSVNFDDVPAPISPTSWRLTVEDWSPLNSNQTGFNSSLTLKTNLPAIELNSLKSWTNITGLESASGIGIYKTTLDISLDKICKNSAETLAVFIHFGDVGGSWGLKINNVQVDGVDFLSSGPLEVTSYVRNGLNGTFLSI